MAAEVTEVTMRTGATRMRRVLSVFKQMDPDLPMSVMVVFLAIAERPRGYSVDTK